MKKYVLTCDMPGAISILPPTGRLARSHPKYFFLGFSAALAPKFHPFHPGAPTLEIPRAQRSRAPGRDLEAQAWIWRPRHGFRVPGMDLEAQAWIWRPGHGFGDPGMDLEAQAWIWRLRHGFRGPGMDLQAQAWIWRPRARNMDDL